MAIVKTDSRHYSEIAAAIRSKNGSAQVYQPRQMSEAILELASGGQNSSIIVYAPAGSQVSISLGETVRTAVENNGIWRFDNCALGTWTVSASLNGMSTSDILVIQEEGQLMRYEVHLHYAKIFGICRDVTSSSTTWTRTDDAAGLTAAASLNGNTGSSDFNDLYPWKEIQRETFSTGDVMVKIPKFWYKRYREGNMEYLKIADQICDGFRLHPAFFHGGVEKDAIYVGAYSTSENNKSESGVIPRAKITRESCRIQANNKGNGWNLLDVATWSAIQMLILVEFANNNVQSVIGKDYCTLSEFSGSKTNTGRADGVPGLTGYPAGTNGQISTVWRGLESLWGNALNFLDGLIIDCTNQRYYVCNDPKNYADTVNSAYTVLSYQIPAVGSTYQYITRVGMDPNFDYLMFPSAAGTGSATTFYTDVISTDASGINVARCGGRWYSGDRAGIFKLDGANNATEGYSHSGSRLIYIP